MDIFTSSEADGFDQGSVEAHSHLVSTWNSRVAAVGGNFFTQHVLVGHLCTEQTEVRKTPESLWEACVSPPMDLVWWEK